MFKSIRKAFGPGRPALSKTQKVLNLLNKGESVSWKVLRNQFDLQSPRAMVDKLRSQGNMTVSYTHLTLPTIYSV